ncbi:head GIN domain-containing protein [Bacteroidota bacterium]
MKYLLSLLLIIGYTFTHAQKTESRNIASFDKVEVFGNIKVEMRLGDKESLEIRTTNVDPSEIITEVNEKLLVIKMKSNLFDDEVEVKISLTFKEIREITSNASAEIKVLDQIGGDKIFANATSGGRILMKVKLNAIELKSYQGAHIDVSGTCKIQESFVNTGGVLAASNFQCDEVFIRMNTGGQAEIVANKRIEANVNTGAKLSYFGKPENETLNTTLGGKITKWDEN